MHINSIQTYCFYSNNAKKGNIKRYKDSTYITQRSAVSFSSAGTNMPTRNFQQEASLLFMNPKYKISFETFRGIFDNISRYISEDIRQQVFEQRKLGLEWGIYGEAPVIIENEHQLSFIENVLAHDIKPDHPIITNGKFDYNAYFSEALIHIKNQENTDAKSRAFDFFMKHPENIFDSDTVNRLLLFSEKEHSKIYIEFIDKNYETITQKLNISKKKLMEHLYHISVDMSWGFNTREGKWFETVWNILMGKENVLDVAKRHKLCKNQIQKRDEYYFKDWYLKNAIKNSPKAQQTVKELRRVFNHDNIEFGISARDLSEIFELDENITIPELLFLDNVVYSFKPHTDVRYAYEIASPYIGKYKREKVNYNENSRKFLWYVADDKHHSYYERLKRFLNKPVLESIKTPEQLATAMKVYDEFSNKGALPEIDNYSMAMFIDYNLSFEDIMKINGETADNYLKLYVYRNLLQHGKFYEKPVEKQLEMF